MISRRNLVGALAAMCAVGWLAAVTPAQAASADELNAAADATLERLKRSEPVSETMIERAKGILVFPEIVKAGLLVGAAGGKGVLRVGGETEGYYRSRAVSYGLQAGVTTFGYVMFLMDDEAVEFVRDTSGWEVGVGPNITIADAGVAKKLSTSTAQEGIYVFFVDQEGFFAGLGLEGTKISKIAE